MVLTQISDIRRRELMQAAFEVLQTEGVQGATLEKVAQRTGASKGLVLHYFSSKQELFEQTMRFTNARLRDEVVRRMKAACSPSERLWAIIEGNFSPEFFRPPICHAWLSLCAEVPWSPQLARVQRVIHARMHSNLRSALVDLIDWSAVEHVALGITTLVDGLWLRAGLQAASIDREEALDQMGDYLRFRVKRFSPPKVRESASQ